MWDDIRTADEIRGNMNRELVGNETNLVGYWKFNNNYLDETSNNNDLTASGSPVFSTDYAFSTEGGDIRVYKSDGTTELPREIVACDITGETGEMHVKYSGTLSSTVDTEIQIHADGASRDYASNDTYGSEAVWSDYKAVYHMQRSSLDSTSGKNNGADTSIAYVAGKIGGSNEYDATSDTTLFPNWITTGTGDFTFTYWLRPETSVTQNHDQIGGSTSGNSWHVNCYNTSGNLWFNHYNGSTDKNLAFSGTFAVDTWYKLAVVRSGDNAYTKTNNSAQSTSSGLSARNFSTSVDAKIGLARTGTAQRGQYDEVRIRLGVLSNDWLDTEYNNQITTATFYTATAGITDVSVDATTQTATFSTPAPTITAGTGVTVSATVLSLNFERRYERMNFDRVNDYVRRTLSGNLTGARTISAYVSVDSTTSFQVVWASGIASYRLWLGTDLELTLNSGGGIGYFLNVNQLYFIEVDYDASGRGIEVRVDGVTVWTGIVAQGTANNVFTVGARESSGTPAGFLGGTIFGVTVSGILDWEGYGITDADWSDNSGNANNGTVVGSPTIYTTTYIGSVATVQIGADISASVLTATFSTPAPNIITPDAEFQQTAPFTASFSVPAYAVTIDTSLSVSPVTATFSIPSPSVQIDVSHAVNALVATFSIPEYIVSAEENVSIAGTVVTATFNTNEVVITAEQNAMIEQGVLIATFTIPEYIVTAIRNVDVDVEVLTATFSTLAPTKVGGLWTAQGRTEGVWTPQPRAI
jgi:hypothetical protein